MYPILYEATETTFTSNGIGRLSDALACTVTEVRNGAYELMMSYPVKGKYFDELQEFRILACTHDMTGEIEPFDIYKISKPSQGVIEVYARHISYRTAKICVQSTGTIESPLQDLFDLWDDPGIIIGTCPFTFTSNLTNQESFIQPDIVPIRQYLYGTDAYGILNVFGYDEGEYLLNKFSISFLRARGSDNGVKFRTGKNVRLLTAETDASEIITSVVPFWLGKDPITGAQSYKDLRDLGYLVYYSNAASYPYQLSRQLDLSNVFEQPPSTSELQAAAQEWMKRHNYNTVNRTSYIIDVASMDENIDACNLCDIVTVEDPVNDYSEKLKITETKWDVLRGEYESIVVGDRRPTITEAFKMQNAAQIQKIANNQEQISMIAKKKAQVTQTITPTTTPTATKIGSVDGVDLYAPGGGGGSGDKKAGGANNQYGVFEDYDASDNKIMTVDKDGVVLGNTTDDAPTTVSEFLTNLTKTLKYTGATTSGPILERVQVKTASGDTYDVGAMDFKDGGDYEEIRLFLGPVSAAASGRKAGSSGYIIIRPKDLDAATQEIEVHLGRLQDSANLRKSVIELLGRVSAQTLKITGGGNKTGGGTIPPMLLLGGYGLWLETTSTPPRICVAQMNTTTYSPIGTTYYIALSS